ncbi:MAG: hypothetical protein LBS59_05860 [Puniceicoccales bacterium]|nr:hypothetical protein [Puniceicoccales bacterium]
MPLRLRSAFGVPALRSAFGSPKWHNVNNRWWSASVTSAEPADAPPPIRAPDLDYAPSPRIRHLAHLHTHPANGAPYDSPGQRPGFGDQKNHKTQRGGTNIVQGNALRWHWDAPLARVNWANSEPPLWGEKFLFTANTPCANLFIKTMKNTNADTHLYDAKTGEDVPVPSETVECDGLFRRTRQLVTAGTAPSLAFFLVFNTCREYASAAGCSKLPTLPPNIMP